MQGLDAYYDGLLDEYQRKIDEQARLEEEAEDNQGEEDES